MQLRWIAKGADRVAALTSLPPACEIAGETEQRALGRIAFESPALLGGAAARMGLSCASCHLNGRGNPDFFLEGLSDEAGTADVTSSVLSKVRGDGSFNARPIPDIGLRDKNQIADRTGAEFARKVHGLIEEEFDGQAPPQAVFDAVIAYLDGLAPDACGVGPVAVSVVRDVDMARAASDAASSGKLESESQLFYLRAARARLERIHERLGAPQQAELRRRLVAASRWLERIAEGIRTGRPAEAADYIAPDWERLRSDLEREEGRSFYNPLVLKAALAAEEAGGPGAGP